MRPRKVLDTSLLWPRPCYGDKCYRQNRPGVRPDASQGASCDDQAVLRTLLIVDDHEQFRRTARALLEAEGFDVVGEAGDGRTAIAAAQRLVPEIVLLDVQLPDMDGFEVARLLAASELAPAIVLTSTRDASSYRHRLVGTPARGFVPKSELDGATIAKLVA